MGNLAAIDMANLADTDIALTWHLTSNHYPPVPLSMLQPCKDAIDAFWEQELDREIALPEGVTYKGFIVAPAWAIIEQHHLWAWTTDNDIDGDDYL